MPNPYFQFKQFTVYHDRCAMKVTTDGCLFGAWVAEEVKNQQRAIGSKQTEHATAQFLDIGTGTGLLSLMVAQKANVQIEAVEIDAPAAEQAKDNIAASPWKDKITVHQQDVLQWQTEKKFDGIFSNPPFYQNELKSARADKNRAHHDEGLQLPELLRFIKKHLKDDGTFFLLLPAKREIETGILLQNAGLFLQQKVRVQQTLKHPPFRVMIQGRRNKVDGVPAPVLAVKNEAGDYTPAFVSLLKAYYLYL